MDVTVIESSSEDKISETSSKLSRNKDYDHFCTESKLWFPKAPDIAVRIAKKEVQYSGTDLRSTTQAKLIRLVKQKVLEHKWQDAALLMQGLTGQITEPRYLPGKFLWEVGNEIIYNHPCSQNVPDIVKNHKAAARNLSAKDVCQARILYEYGLWLLRTGDFNEARQVFRSFHSRGVKYTFQGTYEVHQQMMSTWLPIFEAYLGLIEWIAWKHMQDETEEIRDDTEVPAKVLKAEQAISHFETAFHNPGIWDIFLMKYLEIVEHHDRISEAEEMLRVYAVNNPRNPNSHKYWYEFLVRHPETIDNVNCRIQALSKLHEISPSEYYMLDLHNLRLDSAFSAIQANYDQFLSMATIALGVCMDMLDFDRWKHDQKAWVEIANSLRKVKKACRNDDFKEIVEAVWVGPMRDTWWPQYHFSVTEAKRTVKIDPVCAKAKKSIAQVFLGLKCAYSCT